MRKKTWRKKRLDFLYPARKRWFQRQAAARVRRSQKQKFRTFDDLMLTLPDASRCNEFFIERGAQRLALNRSQRLLYAIASRTLQAKGPDSTWETTVVLQTSEIRWLFALPTGPLPESIRVPPDIYHPVLQDAMRHLSHEDNTEYTLYLRFTWSD